MNILYIILAILMLGIIIIIHELGHFLVGRACGIGVVEFSVGMGPKLFGWRRGDTDYSVRALPVGGYCRFVGEDADDHAPNAMNAMPVWKRFLTVLAGPLMNFLLAFLVAVLIFLIWPVTTGVIPAIDTVVEDTPAMTAGILPGDLVTAVDGVPVTRDAEGITLLREQIQQKDTLELTILRDGETIAVTLTPAEAEAEDGSTVKQIGVVFTTLTHQNNLFEAVRDALGAMRSYSTMMLDILRDLIFHFRGGENMAGAIGTVAVVSEQLKTDFSLILDFSFLISLNLGIINLIPFPGLDGSRLLFLLLEAIRRKPVPPEKEGMVHAIGLVILLGLAAVLAVHDIMTYIL